MNEIQVFNREVKDGVAQAVKSQASIAYCSPASTIVKPVEDSLVQKIVAENKDQFDLYYLESILVSTSWNANDDVFLAEPTWAARHTPEDKQFNFMHNENDIIGHITGSYILDAQGNQISADIDTTPDNFDIVTRVVLYNGWIQEDNKDRMAQIIAEIDQGLDKWFVSMECLFSGFDYAVVDTKGNESVIARNESSSFLTKHLRSYGGSGVYEGFKLGRALRGFAFSGEGLVSNPANQKSIILKSKSLAFNTQKTVTNFIKETDMSDEVKIVEAKLDDAREQLQAATKRNVVLETELASAKIDAGKADDLSVTITERDATIADLSEKLEDSTTKVETLETAATEAATKNGDLSKQVAEMEQREITATRSAALVDAGVNADEVEGTLTSFVGLDDEAFAAVVELYKSKEVASDDDATASDDDKKKEDKKKKFEKKDDSDDDASASLEGVDTDDVSLVSDDDSDDKDALRAGIVSFIDAFNGRDSDSE